MADAPPDRSAIDAHQLDELRKLLASLIPDNAFYAQKLADAGVGPELASLQEYFAKVPYTLKSELIADHQAHPHFGSNLTFPFESYSRFSQTSGTSSGQPLPWLDTAESWQWMVDSWKEVFRAAGVTAEDRIYFAFSFGPFIGFWLAFDAAAQLGCLCIPGGGLGSEARLRSILANDATVLCCTPTYAIRLGEVAAREGIDLGASQVKTLIAAGEPGASIPATRARIEELWPGARPFDHHGMTEVGPVTYESPRHPGFLNVVETHYLAEVVDPESSDPIRDGEIGELVLTTLGRTGSPLLRDRTGDLVKAIYRPPGDDDYTSSLGSYQLALEGGILGRSDDMVIVRGVNVYPSGVEQIVRGVPGIAEFQVRVSTFQDMAEMTITIEPEADVEDPEALVEQVGKAFQQNYALRVPVKLAEPGSLPRFEMKAKRWLKG
ncbi:MAG: phenylacetate--CoA ligase family protein [Verrucomicrobiia bacterium]